MDAQFKYLEIYQIRERFSEEIEFIKYTLHMKCLYEFLS